MRTAQQEGQLKSPKCLVGAEAGKAPQVRLGQHLTNGKNFQKKEKCTLTYMGLLFSPCSSTGVVPKSCMTSRLCTRTAPVATLVRRGLQGERWVLELWPW